jgi:prepilin-type N-terminal cleavage/methylation domain-containing protein
MLRRGFTMIEMTLVMALSALILGAVACLYSFTTTRAGTAVASAACQAQAIVVMNEITKIVDMSNICSITTIGANSALTCIVPSKTTDFDGDGYPDWATPSSASRRGFDKWGQGYHIYFYTSDATGTPANTGPYIWRAKRSDWNTPTVTDSDQNWSLYYAGNVRYPLITSVTFSVNSVLRTVTINVRASDLRRADRSATAADAANLQSSISLTRTVYWRNWRK